MATSSDKEKSPASNTDAGICGIVMPISAIDGCSEAHWGDVKEILEDAIDQAGFVPQLVSEANDVGIIQKRIIQNLYENPIVVCDVSAKNPNVICLSLVCDWRLISQQSSLRMTRLLTVLTLHR